jgi:hypothetical protein
MIKDLRKTDDRGPINDKLIPNPLPSRSFLDWLKSLAGEKYIPAHFLSKIVLLMLPPSALW